MSLGSLVGQRRASTLLGRVLGGDRIPHAVLFCGPEGSGKTAAAVALARSLQCDSDRSDGPCETCNNCSRTRGLTHPDFNVLIPYLSKVKEEDRRKHTEDAIRNPYTYSAPEESANISVDTIRDLIKTFTYGSYQGNWRTAIVLHANKMRGEAANAMLKTLEEPPPKSMLILTAPSLESLLPTIVSRCQYFRLGPVAVPDLSAHLQESRNLPAEQARYVAELSGGNVRLALSIASDEANETQERALRFLTALLEGRESQTFLALEKLASEKRDVFDVLKSAEVWLRDVLHFRVMGAELIVNRQRVADVERLAKAVTDQTISVLAQEIERVREMNRRNINLQLSLTELWRKTRATVPAGSV
jgi:DNA polymerase-3 subunit delta'